VVGSGPYHNVRQTKRTGGRNSKARNHKGGERNRHWLIWSAEKRMWREEKTKSCTDPGFKAKDEWKSEKRGGGLGLQKSRGRKGVTG